MYTICYTINRITFIIAISIIIFVRKIICYEDIFPKLF